MKGGTQAAVAIGVGYVLGRRRKMRTATLLVAATAAGGGMGGIGGAALRRGAKALGSTEALGKIAPQLGEITDAVRGDLVDAGKAAAIAAVSGRMESLTDSLHERAQAIRDPATAVGEAGDTVGRAKGGVSRRARRPADAEDLPDDEDADEEPDAPPRRRSARRSAPASRTRR